MPPQFVKDTPAAGRPVWLIDQADFPAWLDRAAEPVRTWLSETGFEAKPGRLAVVPLGAGAGEPSLGTVMIANPDQGLWNCAALSEKLPPGAYRLAELPPDLTADTAALGWLLGAYAFDRYKAEPGPRRAGLIAPEGVDIEAIERLAEAVFFVRDLVNTPSEEMGPAELAQAALALFKEFGGQGKVIVGDDLLKENYPAIHGVGRASERPPRLIDLCWGRPDAPKVSLVGKGVCFDTGGLNLKTGEYMARMKMDMAGAAHVLGLSRLVMAAGLDVRLRALIPAVENSVSGRAFRPGDILRMRSGKTVEITNTDAEGRLILADSLAEAAAQAPELLVDCATLTGALRIALGPALPGFFCRDDGLAGELLAAGRANDDPLWRLPLWRPYRRLMDSPVADLKNSSAIPQGGSITAALFLAEFVPEGVAWLHLDHPSSHDDPDPGRPKGADAFAVRALFSLLEKRFGPGR